jgi:hypothetical protein
MPIVRGLFLVLLGIALYFAIDSALSAAWPGAGLWNDAELAYQTNS